jgi:hypothetical protein
VSSDRFRDAIEAVLVGLLPTILPRVMARCFRWQYRVQGVSNGPPVTVSGVPVSSKCPYGNLANIELWPGPSGVYAVPAPGSIVLLGFVDGEIPCIVGLDPNVAPIMTTIGGGSVPVAREGDAVQVSFSVSAPSGGGPCTVTPGGTPINGTITGGSATVKTS